MQESAASNLLTSRWLIAGVIILTLVFSGLFGLVIYKNKKINLSLATVTTGPPMTTAPPVTQAITQTPASLPVAVAGTVKMNWAGDLGSKHDITIYFGDNFEKMKRPVLGRVGWNVPDFGHVIETESQWKGKVDVIIYDYETWEKTPAGEKDDPGRAAKTAQKFVDDRGLELILGASFKMVTLPGAAKKIREGNFVWSEIIDKNKVQAIAASVKNFGVNAVGLRNEFPDYYVEFFNTVAAYAREANPNVSLWPVIDARGNTAQNMDKMVKDFGENVQGITIMGGAEDQETISDFMSLMRSGN